MPCIANVAVGGTWIKVMLSMDPANLKEEVGSSFGPWLSWRQAVMSRLQQHKEAFLESSFDNLKKDSSTIYQPFKGFLAKHVPLEQKRRI